MKMYFAVGLAAVMASSFAIAAEKTSVETVVKSVEEKIETTVVEKKGDAKVKLQYVHGVKNDGSLYADKDAVCKQELSSGTTNYVGREVKTTYAINPKSLIMTATSEFLAPSESVILNPLGLAGEYAFGNFSATRYVTFHLSTTFTDPVSTVLVINAGKDYNCAISSEDEAPSASVLKAVETLNKR